MTRKPYPYCFAPLPRSADVKGAKVVLAHVLEDLVRIETILADQSYQGSLAQILSQAHHCVLKVTEKLGDGLITIGDSTLLIATSVRSTRTLLLGDRYQELRQYVKGKDSLNRILFKVTRMLFYELIKEIY